MAIPTKKSEAIENFVDLLASPTNALRTSIENNVCLPEPLGCGGPAAEFKDARFAKEYTITGFCQVCQNEIFGC